ncbi:hypothetical protein Y032_0004g1788 [Ancylostoma ceylanicum]|uniref:Uncharacterized protein n=1 Tax=Ancylostoma ceylanicum TaxID=53326 RepID=A0A016VU05_9BILA|nr:hypothetical protein Y032_0004g1788 [Ancylostoma ceylanicum]
MSKNSYSQNTVNPKQEAVPRRFVLGQRHRVCACSLWLSASASSRELEGHAAADSKTSMQSPCVSAQERRVAVQPLVYGCSEFTV